MSITRQILDKNPSGFTMVEMLITISILAIGFVGIFSMMQNSTKIIQQTKDKTTAINLSREAIEMAHNIRDTNRIRRVGNKDACRLKIDPLENNDGDCSNDAWIQSGRYSIVTKTQMGQQYFAWKPIENGGGDTREQALASRETMQRCPTENFGQACDDPEQDPKILRAIYVSGLYHKNSDTVGGEALNCPTGDSIDSIPCGGSEAKELRFCAHTYILGEHKTHIQLCSAMTNFTP